MSKLVIGRPYIEVLQSFVSLPLKKPKNNYYCSKIFKLHTIYYPKEREFEPETQVVSFCPETFLVHWHWSRGYILIIDHFTVVCLVARPLNESELGVDLVSIETPCFSYFNDN